MTTLAEAFEIPRPEEITALGFVVVLEDQPSRATVERIVRDYVLTPKVQDELRKVLAKLREAFKRGEALGRFIHGSFGSGKSNFMFFLALLLEDDGLAWAKDHHEIRVLAEEYRAFLRETNILPVRLNMLSLNRPGATLDRLVYESFNATLRARGKPECGFLNVDGVLEEVRAEATAFGDQLWKVLAANGVVPSKALFDELAGGSEEDREGLALAYLKFKKRDPATAGVIPAWASGLRKLAAHAKARGYGGVVFFIDEMLLWLTEKENHQFQEAVNQLSLFVDYTGGSRAVPLGALVARQRRLKDFFPEHSDDEQIQALFDRIAGRFETTALEDVELRYICKDRVLAPKAPKLIQATLERLAVDQKKVLPAVIQQADIEYLKDVYPFHPALIEALIDVSALLQRERTALRLLMELLAASRDLPLGRFIPIGRAFELLIPQAGVEGARAAEDDLKALHRLYWRAVRTALDASQNAGEDGFDAQRRNQLDQLVKTALIAEVSPRLKQGGVTIERLVRLNDVEITGETDRTRIAQAYDDIVRLSRKVPAIQVLGAGEAASAIVQVNLRGGDLETVLERARQRVDHVNTRFLTFYSVLGDLLGGEAKAVLGGNAGSKRWTLKVAWRNTKRTGSVLVGNVRELTAATFKPEPGEEFRIIVDYPWDQPPFTVNDDRSKAQSVRRNDGTFFTICWLPRHFTHAELEILKELAAAELVANTSGNNAAQQEELLQAFSRKEREQILTQARTHASTMRTQARGIVEKVYRDAATIEALVDGVSGDVNQPTLPDNLEAFAERLLDRRFPNHPRFELEPKPDVLTRLCDFCVGAAETGQYRSFGEDASLVRQLAGPGALDLVELGQQSGKFNDRGRLYREVMDAAKGDSVQWDPIEKRLEAVGLPLEVRNFFLALVARIHGFRLLRLPGGDEVAPEIDKKPRQGIQLKRAKLLDPTQWANAGDLLQSVLAVPKPTAGRTVAEQDRLAAAARKAGDERRELMQGMVGLLANLGVTGGARVDELREGIKRLAPLVETGSDPFDMFGKILAAWPPIASDPVRAAVQRAAETRACLDAINRTAFDFLGHSADAEAQAHVSALRSLLSAGTQAQPLGRAELEKWSEDAKRIMNRLATAAPAQPPAPVPPEPGKPPPAAEVVAVLTSVLLNLEDPSATARVLEDIKVGLAKVPHKQVTIDVTVRRRG
jgi:hypothetical protein